MFQTDSKYRQALSDLSPNAETRIVDPVTGGEKGQKLARFGLIPGDSLWQLARHFGVGANKYEDRNWERGYKWSLSFEALNRHLWAYWQGEERDEESGSLHIVCVAWHAMVLTAYSLRGIGNDDRPKLAPCQPERSENCKVHY